MYKRAEYYIIKNRIEKPRKFIQVVMGPRQVGKSTVVKQVLQELDTPIGKPALLRQTFELGAAYSGQILSLTKMLGALQDAGNTTTLAGYVRLLDESGLLNGLQKYSIDMARRKSSIPKFHVYNNVLKTIYNPNTFEQTILDRKVWGHVFESGIGAYIISQAFVHRFDVFYWRERNDKVDFVLRKRGSVVAIEVKSNAEKNTGGLNTFKQMFAPQNAFIVGDGGISAGEFLLTDIRKLF